MEGQKRPYSPQIRFEVNNEARCLTRDEWLADEPKYFEWVN
jgi:hypothetical protein